MEVWRPWFPAAPLLCESRVLVAEQGAFHSPSCSLIEEELLPAAKMPCSPFCPPWSGLAARLWQTPGHPASTGRGVNWGLPPPRESLVGNPCPNPLPFPKGQWAPETEVVQTRMSHPKGWSPARPEIPVQTPAQQAGRGFESD